MPTPTAKQQKIIERVLWLLLLFAAQLLYFPINKIVRGGMIIRTPLDAYIPLWTIWTIPYLLSLLWWSVSFLWAAWKMEDELYAAFTRGMLAVFLFSYLFYILYPTYIERPFLAGNNCSTNLLRFVYSSDRSYNAFPSGHTYTSVLITLFWSKWYPEKRWLWIGLTATVLLSTLFTAQHHLPDLLAGTLLAWAGYRFGLSRSQNQTSPAKKL
jgi:membrane-associated phospholipid phosphatase